MQIRALVAAGNGALVLCLYVSAWGAPSFTVALLEVGLAIGAGLATWYALRPLAVPMGRASLASRSAVRSIPV